MGYVIAEQGRNTARERRTYSDVLGIGKVRIVLEPHLPLTAELPTIRAFRSEQIDRDYSPVAECPSKGRFVSIGHVRRCYCGATRAS